MSIRRRCTRHLYRTVRGVENETAASTRDTATLPIHRRHPPDGRSRAQDARRRCRNETQLRNVAIVSAGFFGFFDAPPVIGRYFTPSEDAPPNPAPVAVLSRRLWETQYGSRSDVVGSTLQIDAVAYTIIGVAPDGFVGLWPYQPPAAFVPVATYAASRHISDWVTSYGTAFGLGIIVRRKPDLPVDAASADLTNALRRSYQAKRRACVSAALDSLRPRAVAASILSDSRSATSSMTRAATWLSGVTLIVLLIACANVANLPWLARLPSSRDCRSHRAGVAGPVVRPCSPRNGARILGGIGVSSCHLGARALRALFSPVRNALTCCRPAKPCCLRAGRTRCWRSDGPRANDTSGPHRHGGRPQVGPRGTHARRGLRTALVLLQCTLSVILCRAGLFVQTCATCASPAGIRWRFRVGRHAHMRDITLDSAATVALRLGPRMVKDVCLGSRPRRCGSRPVRRHDSWPIGSRASIRRCGWRSFISTPFGGYFKTMERGSCEGARLRRQTWMDRRASPWSASRWRRYSGLPGRDRRASKSASTTRCRATVVGVAQDITRSPSTPSRSCTSIICRRRSGSRRTAECSCARAGTRPGSSSRYGGVSRATCRERPSSPSGHSATLSIRSCAHGSSARRCSAVSARWRCCSPRRSL